MSTLDNQLYIDAVVVKGVGRTFSVKVEQGDADFLFNDYSIVLDILGSAEGNGLILIRKTITSDTPESTIGTINLNNPGEFTFTITADDTNFLGLGSFPINLRIVDIDTEETVYNLTEGGIAQGEFDKITIVRV
ncbi:MAG: hypothetical protein J6Y02_13195 [Pseudobutyrivibrio sp.]|nr:hypothetical protein [Pseudobutyrivibrio sp.]